MPSIIEIMGRGANKEAVMGVSPGKVGKILLQNEKTQEITGKLFVGCEPNNHQTFVYKTTPDAEIDTRFVVGGQIYPLIDQTQVEGGDPIAILEKPDVLPYPSVNDPDMIVSHR